MFADWLAALYVVYMRELGDFWKALLDGLTEDWDSDE